MGAGRFRGRPGSRSRSFKVVVTGPPRTGKSTFIRTISEITVLSTERPVPAPGGPLAESAPPGQGEGEHGSAERATVAMDFGRVTVGPDLALYLFGIPGGELSGFMWDILSDGMLGFVLMVDASRADSIEEARRIRTQLSDLADAPYVVAVGRTAGDEGPVLEQVRNALELPDQVPVVAADAREREDVKATLLVFLRQAKAWLGHRPGPGARLGTGGSG